MRFVLRTVEDAAPYRGCNETVVNNLVGTGLPDCPRRDGFSRRSAVCIRFVLRTTDGRPTGFESAVRHAKILSLCLSVHSNKKEAKNATPSTPNDHRKIIGNLLKSLISSQNVYNYMLEYTLVCCFLRKKSKFQERNFLAHDKN